MISFQPLSKNHKHLFEHLPPEVQRSSDFNFFNQYIWRRVYHTEIVVFDKSFILKDERHDHFIFHCYGNIQSCIEHIQQIKLWKEKIVYLLSSQTSSIKGENILKEDDSQREYLYLYETIAGFTGQKLQKKRNHLNYFQNHFMFRVETPFDVEIYREKVLLLFSNDEEREALLEYLECPTKPHFLIPLGIWIDDTLVAFTLGNIVHDTCIIHFERARKDIRGSYQAVFYYLLEELKDKNITWINREQDLGLEHLRIAKRSYYPDGYITKYRIILS